MSEIICINKSDLPAAAPSSDAPDCIAVDGVDHSVWPISAAVARVARLNAYEYLAAAEAIEKELLKSRQEAVCDELGCPGLYQTLMDNAPMKRAIDRIIELEATK